MYGRFYTAEHNLINKTLKHAVSLMSFLILKVDGCHQKFTEQLCKIRLKFPLESSHKPEHHVIIFIGHCFRVFYVVCFPRDPRAKIKDGRKERTAHPSHQGNYAYPVQSSYYPDSAMAAPPHPPVMYPVPMIPVYPGYAPWLAPLPGYGVVNNGFPDGRHGR